MTADVLAQARAWLADDEDPVTHAELAALLAATGPAAAAALADRFSGPLEFGTAGLRGVLGAGESRMNRVVVRRVTAGLAAYVRAHVPDAATRGVVIGHDARRMSREFAEDAARVLAGAGLKVLLAPRGWPTPTTAWMVTTYRAAAGIMVTASHNPPEYNGYKVYWHNGAQIIPPEDGGIAAAAAAAPRARDVPMPTLEAARAAGLVVDLDEAAHDAYVAAVLAERAPGPRDALPLVVAYTPLHGIGAPSVEAAFARGAAGELTSEPSQRAPDGEFPTVAFPNPEEPGAMDRVLALAVATRADLVLANDPDADRLCVAIPDDDAAGAYRLLTGDQVGALIADYLLTITPTDRPRLVATTIVSSQLLSHLAAASGAAFRETLTGFKWIANAAIAWEAATGGRFLMGYEEALGYTIGSLVRDKDGVSSAIAMADLARWNRAQGRTVGAHLDDIYRRVGLFVTASVSWNLPGAAGLAQIREAMGRFRAAPPTAIAGVQVRERADLATPTSADLPASDVLVYRLVDGSRVIMRPSGTEPKLKSYYEVRITIGAGETTAAARARGQAQLVALRDAHQATLRG